MFGRYKVLEVIITNPGSGQDEYINTNDPNKTYTIRLGKYKQL